MHCFLLLPTDMHNLYLTHKTVILGEEQGPLGLQSSGNQLNPHTQWWLAMTWLQICSHQQGFSFLSQRAWLEDGGLLEGVIIQLTKRRKNILASKLSNLMKRTLI